MGVSRLAESWILFHVSQVEILERGQALPLRVPAPGRAAARSSAVMLENVVASRKDKCLPACPSAACLDHAKSLLCAGEGQAEGSF